MTPAKKQKITPKWIRDALRRFERDMRRADAMVEADTRKRVRRVKK
jgi:hypothetical protein